MSVSRSRYEAQSYEAEAEALAFSKHEAEIAARTGLTHGQSARSNPVLDLVQDFT